jgi:hypothetical protein
MCVPWATKLKDQTNSIRLSMPFVKAIGVPFFHSSKARCKNYGTKCIYKELIRQIHEDYLSRFSSLIYFKNRELRALQ